ncbi:MAG TPA: amidohydrolase family protein [Gaiellales bacterium]
MTHDLVVRGGRVLGAHGEATCDVAVDDGRIAALGSGLHGRRELDAGGLYVLPGAIDGHVHMRTERPRWVYDDTFASGSVAAAFGGVTTFIDQAQVEPGIPLVAGLEARMDEAAGECVVDYGIHVNLREASRERIAEIPELVARGCPTLKLFMAYEEFRLPDPLILAAMQELARAGGTAIVHAENQDLIDELERGIAAGGRSDRRSQALAHHPALEGEAVYRALAMALIAGVPLLVFHLTAAEAVRELEAARARGQAVYGEVCLPYLLLDEDAYDVPVSGPALPTGPPLRDAEHVGVLWDALARGAIDIVSTDHGPRRTQRDDDGGVSIPPGTSGVEVRLALMHSAGVAAGRLTPERWVDACCTRPAEVFGLTRKGRLEPGYDADIVLFDPARRVTLAAAGLHSAVDHSTYEGWEVTGAPVATVVRGEVVVADGELQVEPGHGRFVAREARR